MATEKLSAVSFFALRLEMRRRGGTIGNGTGFVYQPQKTDKLFLVTNYHVATAKYPEEPSRLIDGFPGSPDELAFSIFVGHDLRVRSGSVRLGDGPWLEHKDRSKGVDIAAIPVAFPDDARIFTQGKLDLVEDIPFEVGADLFIVGFPYGYGAGDLFPIWKRGTVASEPAFKPSGLARFYIDSFTKPGMSGSPVFATAVRDLFFVGPKARARIADFERGDASAIDALDMIDPAQMKATPTRCLQLVGIFSSHIMLSGDRDPNIGVVWRRSLVDELFSNPQVANSS